MFKIKGRSQAQSLLAYWWPGAFPDWRRRVSARNIDIVLGGLADAIRSRDPERIAEFLGPDLVWEGLEPGLRCDGRQQAMSVIRHRFAAAPLIVQAVEAIEAGPHVIVGLRGPGFNGTAGDLETMGQIFNVFTLSAGKVIRWRDFLTRREALAAADAEDQPWQ
jgi:SnoaL-like domain